MYVVTVDGALWKLNIYAINRSRASGDAQCTRSGPKIDRHEKPNLRVSVEDITLFTHFER